MTTYFGSDTHFFHANVIKYCNRPFSTVEEMNAHYISEWQKKVNPADTVYFLGDFCFAGTTKAKEILDQLPGYKILIRGNHDFQIKPKRWLELGFAEYHTHLYLPELDVNLCHFPYLQDGADQRYPELRLKDEGITLLHGHIHSKKENRLSLTSQGTKMYDVGVDANGYSLVTWEQINESIKARS